MPTAPDSDEKEYGIHKILSNILTILAKNVADNSRGSMLKDPVTCLEQACSMYFQQVRTQTERTLIPTGQNPEKK